MSSNKILVISRISSYKTLIEVNIVNLNAVFLKETKKYLKIYKDFVVCNVYFCNICFTNGKMSGFSKEIYMFC